MVYPWVVPSRLLALLIFLTLSPAMAAPDAGSARLTPPDAVAPTSPGETLLAAIAHYQRSEFDRAKQLLVRLVAVEEKQRSRVCMEALLYLGFVHVAYGEGEAAQDMFQRALDLDPRLSLPVRSPGIEAVFDQARRRFEARRRALDHDPPRLEHHPPAKAPHGKPLAIAVRADDPSRVKRVVLNHRLAGNRGFSSVNMELEAGKGGRYVATIPGMSVARPGVEYYVSAWDSLNNGPGLKGSAGAPIKIKVQGGPLHKAPQPRSWYQKWWVWATVAGVVAVAGGAALGVYLNRDEVGRINTQLPSGLDP